MDHSTSTGPGYPEPSQEYNVLHDEECAACCEEETDAFSAAGEDAMTDIGRRTREAGEQFKKQAVQAKDTATRQGREMAEHQRQRLAMVCRDAGKAGQRAADTLREQEDSNLAGFADAESFTRRQPAAVYGGLFVAGVAMARLLKASQRRQPGQSTEV
jgi:hypothetical protein